jgi:hypothetical protein
MGFYYLLVVWNLCSQNGIKENSTCYTWCQVLKFNSTLPILSCISLTFSMPTVFQQKWTVFHGKKVFLPFSFFVWLHYLNQISNICLQTTIFNSSSYRDFRFQLISLASFWVWITIWHHNIMTPLLLKSEAIWLRMFRLKKLMHVNLKFDTFLIMFFTLLHSLLDFGLYWTFNKHFLLLNLSKVMSWYYFFLQLVLLIFRGREWRGQGPASVMKSKSQ